jgi:hypothetical protein
MVEPHEPRWGWVLQFGGRHARNQAPDVYARGLDDAFGNRT